MAKALEIGVYLLTATHIGSGQAAGAVDLPIVRESHTDYPLLPSTAIKGVLRREVARDAQPSEAKLFGSHPTQLGAAEPKATEPGALAFTDGHLLAFPVRSLQAAFYCLTCPWIIERWNRQRAAFGFSRFPDLQTQVAPASTAASGALVLENVFVSQLAHKEPQLIKVAADWSSLLPKSEPELKARFKSHLVCVPDAIFADLVRRTTPVNARVQLTPGKTTDTWLDIDDGNKEYKGNLWYEEALPPECLFSVLVTSRDGRNGDVASLSSILGKKDLTAQIGGNETVGQGFAAWTSREA